MGKANLLSSKLVVGILVVEDFAAVAIIAVLSGVATTGTADVGDVGSLVLRLVIFVVASLVLGTLIVRRIVSFTHKFHSKEVLLITCLGLCFGLALLGKELGLSVAAGAFIMGALIGDTRYSESITEVVTPVRDMFAALFFVAIGMLINIFEFTEFIAPAIIVAVVFMLGKILSNVIATFMCGYDGKTSLQVGMAKPVMGEFSLAIAKLGVDRGVVIAPLYPVIALVTALTSFAGPYIMRSTDAVSSLFGRRSPTLLRAYAAQLSDWLQSLKAVLSRDSKVAVRVRHSVKSIVLNLVIVMVIIGIGTFALQFVEDIARVFNMPVGISGLLFGAILLALCIPCFVVIWRSLRALADEAATHLLRGRPSAGYWRHEGLRIVLRDSILIVLTVFAGLWLVPIMVRLLSLGSFSVAVPLLLITIFVFLVLGAVRRIHCQLERTFSRTLLGEEHVSTAGEMSVFEMRKSRVAKSAGKLASLITITWHWLCQLISKARAGSHK
jgi:CPA2 family monovalent cation:H+ antiporter-2